MTEFEPTHVLTVRFVDGRSLDIEVMVEKGVAYTAAQWREGLRPSWFVHAGRCRGPRGELPPGFADASLVSCATAALQRLAWELTDGIPFDNAVLVLEQDSDGAAALWLEVVNARLWIADGSTRCVLSSNVEAAFVRRMASAWKTTRDLLCASHEQ